jgi:hypothetical protein
MKIAAAIIVAGVLGFWAWTHHQRTVTEHRLEAVADVLAGRPVGVTCQGFWGAMLDINGRSGEVQFPVGRPPDHMFLTRGVCGRLSAFIGARSHHDLDCLATIDWTRWSIDADYNGDCERHARSDVEAINTLVHESMHLRGITSEAQAQCYAIQGDAWTVVRLGGTPTEGAAAANYVLALQPGLPSEYQSSGCHAGGSLDLTPGTPAFPSESPPTVPPE